jgi:hypothetical protein
VNERFLVPCRRFHNVAYCRMMEPAGLEPATSGLQSRRSPN